MKEWSISKTSLDLHCVFEPSKLDRKAECAVARQPAPKTTAGISCNSEEVFYEVRCAYFYSLSLSYSWRPLLLSSVEMSITTVNSLLNSLLHLVCENLHNIIHSRCVFQTRRDTLALESRRVRRSRCGTNPNVN